MSSIENQLYYIDHIDHIKKELFYLAQNPSVTDINAFFRENKIYNIYLRKSSESEAEVKALKKVSKALQSLATGDYSGFRKNQKKVFLAQKCLDELDISGLFKVIQSIYFSYEKKYFKEILRYKLEQKRQILEDLGVDRSYKTSIRRDLDEIEDQTWTATGQLARADQQSSNASCEQYTQENQQQSKQLDKEKPNHSSVNPLSSFSIQPNFSKLEIVANAVIPKATKAAQNSKPSLFTPYIQIPPSINISANSFLFTTSALSFNSSSLSINDPTYKKQTHYFSTNKAKRKNQKIRSTA